MNEIISKFLSIKFFTSLAVIIASIVCYVLFRSKIKVYLKKHRSKVGNSTASNIVYSIIEFLILFFGAVVVLEIYGVDITAIITGLGLVSAIIGLALQDYLKDIIMGLHIISDHFFSIGECIEYNGRVGEIISMSLKTTKLCDIDDRSVFTICNRNITEAKRISERLDIDIPLSYGEKISDVHNAFNSIVNKLRENKEIKDIKFLGTQKFDNSAIIYRLRINCEPKKRFEIKRTVLGFIQIELEKAGIQIPFNQLDVHCDIVK